MHKVSAQAHGRPEGVMVEIKMYSAGYKGTLAPLSEVEELAWLKSTDENRVPIAGKLILRWLKEQNLID
jgi:8-oxo-dGTP diphosphatase